MLFSKGSAYSMLNTIARCYAPSEADAGRTSDRAFMALNISMATSTDKDSVDALALPYVK